MTDEKRYSLNQLEIVRDLCQTHGLQAEQISFEGDDLNPIFDYEAISLLRLRLTDIKLIDCSEINRDQDSGRSTCYCTVVLADGRSLITSDSAAIGDEFHDGTKVDTVRKADSLARSRVSRLGVRSLGINLFNAHKKFKETGEIATGTPTQNPRAAQLAELHALASEAGLIINGDRSRYEKFIADSYDGQTSSEQLNDLDFQRLIIQLRAMARHTRSMQKVPA